MSETQVDASDPSIRSGPDPERLWLLGLKVWVCLVLAWWVLSSLLIPVLLQQAYRGGSLPFLNRLIEGQSSHTLEFYLAAWKSVKWKVIRMLALAGLLAIPLLLTWPRLDRWLGRVESPRDRRAAEIGLVSLLATLFGLGSFLMLYRQPVTYVQLISEDSWAEWGTFVALTMGVVALAWRLLLDRKSRRIGYIFLLLAIFLVAMEEISWGQRLLGISPPEFFVTHNRQEEINFHNLVATTPMYTYVAAAILLWCVISTGVVRRLPAIRQVVAKLGIPLVPDPLLPMFALSVLLLLATRRYGLVRLDELAEFAVALALAALALHAALSWRGGAVGFRTSLIAGAAFMVVLLTATAGLVRFEGQSRKWRLNTFAALEAPRLGLYRQAADVFAYLERHSLVNEDFRLKEASVFRHVGNESEATRILEIVVRNEGEKIRKATKDPAPYRELMIAYHLLARNEEASRTLRLALRADSARLRAAGSREERAKALWSTAKTLLAAGRRQRARASLEQACEVTTRSSTLYRLGHWALDEAPELAPPRACFGRR